MAITYHDLYLNTRMALTGAGIEAAQLEARELIKGRVLDNNIEYDARTAADALAKATRSEVVQVIGTKFVLYRESHSKPREKRIQLVKTRAKK